MTKQAYLEFMASNDNLADLADFNERYHGWVAAIESGDSRAIRTAEADLPSLTDRVKAKLAAIDEAEADPDRRAEQRRMTVLVSEVYLLNLRRQRKKREAKRRRQDRATLLERSVELPTKCARCGVKLRELKTTGRPRVYCSPACRKAAYEDRRAHRDGAVQVQLVEKIVTEVRERRHDVPHPKRECVDAVLKDDAALLRVVRTLIDNVRDFDNKAYSTSTRRFWDLHSAIEVLLEKLTSRASAEPIEQAEPHNRRQRNMHRMTFRPEKFPGSDRDA
ncbi:hypothetical protein [Leucobacter sp. W1478]|uniref:hypothetical protein n=1 Tax=Leucobacter sp. W1478 TaxID=3439065 RepID=UPI003F3B0B26